MFFPWGNTFSARNARYEDDSTGDVGTMPGGVSWVGTLDQAGNVWEWVSSLHQPYPYNANDGRENAGDKTSARVMRGGSWNSYVAQQLRSTTRIKREPTFIGSEAGFRCVRPFEQP